jgi:hypothetical protein
MDMLHLGVEHCPGWRAEMKATASLPRELGKSRTVPRAAALNLIRLLLQPRLPLHRTLRLRCEPEYTTLRSCIYYVQ